MEGLGLLLISIILILIVGVIGTVVTILVGVVQLIVGIFSKKRKPTKDVPKGVGSYLKNLAISVDMLGNVLLSPMWNALLIKDLSIHPFGNPYETISDNLGENKKANNLTRTGMWLANVLHKLDTDHVERSIRPDYKKEEI